YAIPCAEGHRKPWPARARTWYLRRSDEARRLALRPARPDVVAAVRPCGRAAARAGPRFDPVRGAAGAAHGRGRPREPPGAHELAAGAVLGLAAARDRGRQPAGGAAGADAAPGAGALAVPGFHPADQRAWQGHP